MTLFAPGRVEMMGPTPKDVAGLLAWYRADLGVTLGSGKVTAVVDQTLSDPSGKDLSDYVVPGNGPTITSASSRFNGHDCFTWSNSRLSSHAFTTAPSLPYTMYCCLYLTSNTVQHVAFNGLSSNDTADAEFTTLASSGTTAMYAGALLSGGPTINGATKVIVCVFNGTSSKLLINSYSTATLSGNAGSQVITGLTLGVSPTGAPWLGDIADFAMYSGAHAVGGSDMQLIAQTYMGTRYGVTVT